MVSNQKVQYNQLTNCLHSRQSSTNRACCSSIRSRFLNWLMEIGSQRLAVSLYKTRKAIMESEVLGNLTAMLRLWF